MLYGCGFPPPSAGPARQYARSWELGSNLVEHGPHEEPSEARGCSAVPAKGVPAEEDRVYEGRKSEHYGKAPYPPGRLARADGVTEAEPPSESHAAHRTAGTLVM